MDDNQKERAKVTRKVGGLLFIGCMFVGMAVGWYFGRMNIGMFGGMGIGFIMMAVVILSNANKK